MTLRDQLTEDMKNAMRSKDALTLGTVRFLLAAVKNVEIEQGALSDEEVQDVIRKQIKQMRDSISQYESGGRTDLAAEEKEKLTILQKYLPAQMSREAIEALVKEVRSAQPELPMGQVIGAVKGRAGGAAEGSLIAEVVKAEFAS